MKVLLMFPDRSFELQQEPPWNARELMEDLELEFLLGVMSASDELFHEVAQKALLSAMANGEDVIAYRQQVLQDCLENKAVVAKLYQRTVDAISLAKKDWLGLSSEYPSSLLYSSNELVGGFVNALRTLRQVGERHHADFKSLGFKQLFAMLATELNEEYLAEVERHVVELRFNKGVLISAELGDSNESKGCLLRRAPDDQRNWLERLVRRSRDGFTFHLDPRHEAGARILSEMRTRAIVRVARALSDASDHVVNFFAALRTELAFYLSCLNLHDWLTQKSLPVTFPVTASAGTRTHRFTGLFDISLAIRTEGSVVGNTIDAAGKSLAIITGANQGGKSTFLRSIGLAHLMMQCGMFVPAESFFAETCPALITHYKREEDPNLASGKLDEELSRLSDIAEHISANSLLLLNESFAATNDREGSEIARQIVSALHEKGVKIFYVTHLHEFARRSYLERTEDMLFLRAERKEDGERTFKLIEGEPLDTSYGLDLLQGKCQRKHTVDRLNPQPG